jgi:hypothetical protein
MNTVETTCSCHIQINIAYKPVVFNIDISIGGFPTNCKLQDENF